MVPFEDDNVAVYRLLLRIEVAVREIVREALQNVQVDAGRPSWQWSRKIPGEFLNVIRQAEQDEQKRRELGFARLGPLYYLTYGELLNILNQKIGLQAVKRLGGEGVLAQLWELTEIRNAIAHSRKVSAVGRTLVEAVHAQIETALTPSAFAKLLENPDVGLRREDARPLLIAWAQSVQEAVSQLPRSLPLSADYHLASRQYWWTSSEVAGFAVQRWDDLQNAIERYNALPDGVGSAAARARFLETVPIRRLAQNALNCWEC